MDVIEHRPITHEGRAYLVALLPDPESRPQDAECFLAEDIAAWDRGEWRFITIHVMGEEGGHASLGSVVYGTFNGQDITMDSLIADDYYVPSLIREVRAGEDKPTG